MLFNSLPFLYFFVVVSTLYFVVEHRFRWMLLLVASCYFYMFFRPIYILILFFTIIIDYFAGIYIENAKGVAKRNGLIVSIIANVGFLAIFKYYNFFNENISSFASYWGFHNPLPFLDIALPIGLSFHTFQAMSYTIEVYRGHQKAEKHLGLYALYVMFYPQLVAGPIERPQNILPQFYEKKEFSYENAIQGLNLMVYGFFKKVVVADNLAVYVNRVYEGIEGTNSISALFAIFFFSIQIYCDFSGYTDIARGAAKFMGFDLMLNFDRPYLATSFSDFWSKWHISLSTWFRDYVYMPLGGNRVTKWRHYINLMLVFLLSGFWHGANWTFIVWGAIHGAMLLVEDMKKRVFPSFSLPHNRLYSLISGIFVFAFVSFALVFFRANTLSDALALLCKVAEGHFSFYAPALTFGLGFAHIALCFVVVLLLALTYLLPKNLTFKRPEYFLIVMCYLIFLLGRDGRAEFIYFQF